MTYVHLFFYNCVCFFLVNYDILELEHYDILELEHFLPYFMLLSFLVQLL